MRGSNLGAVKVVLISPTRILLVRKRGQKPGAVHRRPFEPMWGFPGGSIVDADAGIGKERVINAAIRETLEETGIALEKEEISYRFDEDRCGSYLPYLCVAEISDAKMNGYKPVTYEYEDGVATGEVLDGRAFTHAEFHALPDLLSSHRRLFDRLTREEQEAAEASALTSS